MNNNNFSSDIPNNFDCFMGQDFSFYEPYFPSFNLDCHNPPLRELEMDQDLLKMEVLNFENPDLGADWNPEEEFAEANFDVKDPLPGLSKKINKEEEVTKENTNTNTDNIINDNAVFVEPKADLAKISIDKGQRFSKKNDKGRHCLNFVLESPSNLPEKGI